MSAEQRRLKDTAERILAEMETWLKTCPYNGFDEVVNDFELENFCSEKAESIRDDIADQQHEENKDG